MRDYIPRKIHRHPPSPPDPDSFSKPAEIKLDVAEANI
jgi:hypothetical protein